MQNETITGENDIDEIRKNIEREARSWGASALYNNLKWWANEESKCNQETLEIALEILDDIIFNEHKEDFLITISVGDIFYRARTVCVDDFGTIEKGIHSSSTRLFGYNWEESREPPAKYAAANRNSKKKEQALYVASNEITACAEVRPPIRSLISIARFVANSEMNVIDFSKVHYSKALNNKDIEYGIDTRKYLSKVLALFSAPVYNKEEYRITQKLVEHFREKGYHGVKYRSFYADGFNFTFFDEYINNFVWEDSRVVLNYASSNLFISLDRGENALDIENISNVQKQIPSDLRNQIWEDVSKSWKFSLPIDEWKIANLMQESIRNGEKVTQKELAQKANVTLTKIHSVQRKLKAAGIIQYIGHGKNGYWIWNNL